VNLDQGGTGSLHAEGLLDAGNPIGIRNPLVKLAHFTGAFVDDGRQRLALDAAGRRAEHGFVVEQELVHHAFDRRGVLTTFSLIAQVFDIADQVTEFAVGNFISEGVNDDILILDEGDVEDRIFGIAGEAGVIPKQDATGIIPAQLHIVEHLVEAFTTDNGFAAARVFVDVAQDELMSAAICLDFKQLGIDGAFLPFATGITQVGIDDGGGGQGGGRGNVGHLRLTIYD